MLCFVVHLGVQNGHPGAKSSFTLWVGLACELMAFLAVTGTNIRMPRVVTRTQTQKNAKQNDWFFVK